MIQLERAYDAERRTDGTRLLVERLWPRGVKKTVLKIEGWLKDVAPSTELRKWFSHDPAKWMSFGAATSPNSRLTRKPGSRFLRLLAMGI